MPGNLLVAFGVNQYSSSEGFRSLNYCANDAQLFCQTLERADPSLDVIAIETGQVRAEDLDAAAALLRESIQPGDQVTVYFAGHGFTHRGADYLAFSDSSLDSRANCRSVTDLQRTLREIGAGKIVLVLDCCRQLMERSPDVEAFRGVATHDAKLDVVSFLGCRIGQVSQEHPNLGHSGGGVFTTSLCSVLENDTTASIQRLESEVQRAAQEITQQLQLRPQHPQVVGPFAFATLDIFGRESASGVLTAPRQKRLILITGATQAGKTTLGRRMQELLPVRHVEMSGYVARRYREYLHATNAHDSVQDFVEHHLWPSEGEDVVARDLLADIQNATEDLIVTGGRRPEEVELLKAENWDIVQIYLHSSISLRWRRAVEIMEDYESKSYEAFVHRNLREFGWGLAKTGTMSGARIVANENDELSGLTKVVLEMRKHGWNDVELDLRDGQRGIVLPEDGASLNRHRD